MKTFAKRNLKLFFRDRGAVFFSLLTVFIIIALYAIFLKDTFISDFNDVKDIGLLMNEWLMASILAVVSMTSTLGAFAVMVDDKTKKIYKDFYSAPIQRRSITGGYFLGAFSVGLIMSLVTLVIAEIYIVISGGNILPIADLIKVLGIIVVSAMMNTAFVCFIVSFFETHSAFSSANTIIGTLVGFLAGIYLPISALPEAVQMVVKIFPVSHAASLIRDIFVQSSVDTVFAGAPANLLPEFKTSMGIVYEVGGTTITPWMSLIYLALTAIMFFALANYKLSRKNK